ncbi:MAG: hypothetical protein QM652_11660 [Legionella sp.]|uniref:hypothetical protein n=1 Tax=Legionella sp. TaxID=459 RepID=UPI0039E68442
MHEYELKHLQQQLDRLNNDVSKQKTSNFIWLIILSNLLFVFFVAHVGLKRDVNGIIKNTELKTCLSSSNDKPSN